MTSIIVCSIAVIGSLIFVIMDGEKQRKAEIEFWVMLEENK